MMKKTHMASWGALLALGLVGCAAQFPEPPMPKSKVMDYTASVAAGKYSLKVQNFAILVDASSSMEDPYKEFAKSGYAKNTILRLNQAIPSAAMEAELRDFGPWNNNSHTNNLFGLKKYSKDDLGKAASEIKTNGPSPLEQGLAAVQADFKESKGKTALIVVGDGENGGAAAVDAANQLKAALGDRLCIYTIQVGDSAAGKELFESLVSAGKCGSATTADQLEDATALNKFVETVFLEGAKDSDGDGIYDAQDKCPGTPKGTKVDAVGCSLPVDSDGDGVTDDKDKCPNTLKGLKVDAMGCPLDSDGDGVLDAKDKCPNTPKGDKVDQVGCTIKVIGDSDGDGVKDDKDKCPNTLKGAKVDVRGCWVIQNLHFDTNKSTIKPESFKNLDEVVEVLKHNADAKVTIEGHTDNIGKASKNLTLSEERAKAVVDYLTSKGVKAEMLSSKGYGYAKPANKNDTPEGRAKNRRVEIGVK